MFMRSINRASLKAYKSMIKHLLCIHTETMGQLANDEIDRRMNIYGSRVTQAGLVSSLSIIVEFIVYRIIIHMIKSGITNVLDC